MVDNDNACEPDKRGVLESIASKLAPTVSRDCVKNQKKDTGQSRDDINLFASWNVSDAAKLRPRLRPRPSRRCEKMLNAYRGGRSEDESN